MPTNCGSPDYRWMGFSMPAALAPDLRAQVDDVLAGQAQRFAVADAVFEAELLVDADDGRVWVLEFSPRITGGWIPELIRSSSGVDLERAALATLLGLPCDHAPTIDRPATLRRRMLGGAHPRPGPGDDARRVVRERTGEVLGRAFVDEIRLH